MGQCLTEGGSRTEGEGKPFIRLEGAKKTSLKSHVIPESVVARGSWSEHEGILGYLSYEKQSKKIIALFQKWWRQL